jgi:hypothetical protein
VTGELVPRTPWPQPSTVNARLWCPGH